MDKNIFFNQHKKYKKEDSELFINYYRENKKKNIEEKKLPLFVPPRSNPIPIPIPSIKTQKII